MTSYRIEIMKPARKFIERKKGTGKVVMPEINGNDVSFLIKKLENFFLSREEVVFAWLFGSYAERSNNRHSDLDIAIYVKDRALLSDTDWYLGLKAELMVFTNKEIDLVLLNLAAPLVKHVANMRKIVLLCREPIFEAEYSLRIIHEYNDVRYWARKTRERLLEG